MTAAWRVRCSVAGCGRDDVYAKGLCKLHYERQRQGRMLEGRVRGQPWACVECGAAAIARDRCERHYKRLWRRETGKP
jgi:hypothetical protein